MKGGRLIRGVLIFSALTAAQTTRCTRGKEGKESKVVFFFFFPHELLAKSITPWKGTSAVSLIAQKGPEWTDSHQPRADSCWNPAGSVPTLLMGSPCQGPQSSAPAASKGLQGRTEQDESSHTSVNTQFHLLLHRKYLWAFNQLCSLCRSTQSSAKPCLGCGTLGFSYSKQTISNIWFKRLLAVQKSVWDQSLQCLVLGIFNLWLYKGELCCRLAWRWRKCSYRSIFIPELVNGCSALPEAELKPSGPSACWSLH